MKTQKQAVLAYLGQGRKITQLDALLELGIMRLASRINELKHPKDGSAGWNIQDGWQSGTAVNGGRYKIKEYWLNMVDA